MPIQLRFPLFRSSLFRIFRTAQMAPDGKAIKIPSRIILTVDIRTAAIRIMSTRITVIRMVIRTAIRAATITEICSLSSLRAAQVWE